jgi:hypothetical protein
MTEQLYWGILTLATGVLLVLAGVLRHYLSIRGNLAARNMLHKERMSALSKDLEPPSADPFPVASVRESRLGSAYLAKLITVPGLVLLFGGIGMGLGFLNSTHLREWASLAWIPIFMGGGLLLYLLIARKYFKEKPK